MKPHDYYYNRFPAHVKEWARQASSRHEHSSDDPGIFIFSWDLTRESVSHVPDEERLLFQCALACTVLIGQVMHAHFREHYKKFHKMTLYPQVESGLSGGIVGPWGVFRSNLKEDEIDLSTVRAFFDFFADDLAKFFTSGQFPQVAWDEVKPAMLNDYDVTSGEIGALFKAALVAQTTPA